MSFLVHNLLHFGRLLHALGLDVHAGRMLDVASALPHVDIGRRQDFYFTLQSLLIHRQQDLAMFDEAFGAFWRRPAAEWSTSDLRALGEQRRFGKPQADMPAGDSVAPDDPSLATLAEPVERVAAMSYGSHEVSRVKDFAQFTDEELQRGKDVIASLTWHLGMRRTMRWEPGHGRMLDFRRLVRRNIRHGGELLSLPVRTRKSKHRPVVLICDVSGSMDRYARMLLHFMYSLAGGPARTFRVEAFLFATRLTRITRDLSRRGASDRVLKVPLGVPDWGGGTRIGEALRAFNVRWAKRVMGHGPVVLLISDGWDRGEPALLREQMARLQLSCHRLIWLNPLLGSPDYQPLTRGMQAALPFVDDFLPVHNLASLEALGEHLSRLPPHRSARRLHGSPVSI
jgi:uncharacterized protein with von Willebrand factor type A (vWA) domain